MDWLGILVWGLGSVVAMTVVEAAGLWLGFTRMSTPIILGTFAVSDRERAAFVGTGFHIVFGWGVTIIYALIFLAAGVASWWLGLILGVGHALFVMGIIIPALPAVHPRMVSIRHGPEPARALQSPGFLALNYGRSTILVTLASHMAYGSTFGALYSVPA